ncbi:MAG: hypothetical protein AAGA48_22895 [Myxococcota bacterium]
MELPFDTGRGFTEEVKVFLALGAMFLALFWPWRPSARRRRPAVVVLVLLTLMSAWNYARWGPKAVSVRIDTYDVIHYYLNAKYFDELGYLDLYPTMLLADAENEGPFFKRQGDRYLAQSEDKGHFWDTITHGIERGREVREARFTEARWAQFEHDALYLQRVRGCMEKTSKGACRGELNERLWHQLISDHGFNGTVAWVWIARPFAEVVPVESIKLLGFLDIALLGLAIASVVWAYGGIAGLWTALFLLTTYSTRWPYLSWVFLRYDWVAALIITMSLLKKGRPFLAGLTAGYTAVLRMFPIVWMWGPFGKGAAGLLRGHVRIPLLIFAGGFLVAATVLQGASTLRFGGDQVQAHFENMLDHNSPEQLSSRRVGLALALSTSPTAGTGRPTNIQPEHKALIRAQQPLRYALAGLLVIALGWVVRRLRDDEAYAYGFLPFFWITTASYYYYVARITLALAHAADLDRSWRHRVGLAMLFAMEVFANWASTTVPRHRMVLIGTLAWMLVVYGLIQLVWMEIEARGQQSTPRGRTPGTLESTGAPS